MGLLEEVVAVGGYQARLEEAVLAQDLQRHFGAGRTEAPYTPPEVGEALGLLSRDLEHHVADFDAGLVRGTAGRDAGDHELRARVGGVHPEPWVRGPGGAAGL